MGQVLRQDSIPPLTITTGTILTMPGNYLGQEARITVGGQQYKPGAPRTINTAVNGAGGLDTGSLAADTLYYVYAVNNSGSLALIASLAAPATGPTGFTAWKKVSKFRTFVGSATIAALPMAASDKQWTPFTPGSTITTNATWTGFWRRNEGTIEVINKCVFGGNNTQGTVEVDLPLSLSFATGFLTATYNVLEGNGRYSDGPGSNFYPLTVGMADSNTINLRWFTEANEAVDGVTSANFSTNGGLPDGITNTTDDEIQLFYTAPIVEWADLDD